MKQEQPMQWHEQLPIVINAGITRILLHGPPDTGKTTTAGKTAQAKGQAVYRLQCSRDQGVEDLLGQFVLEKGETRFAPGPIPQAMQSGGMLIMDEFDMRNPAHDSIYHSIMDDAEIAEVRLPDGTVIKPQPGFTVVCTTNADPKMFTPALLRRWELKLYCAIAHPEALKTVDKQEAKFLHNLQTGVKTPEFRFEFCVSSFRAARKLKDSGLDPEFALSLVFGEAAAKELQASLCSMAS